MESFRNAAERNPKGEDDAKKHQENHLLICGGLLAVSMATGGMMFPATALADYDPYGRGEYWLTWSMAYTGFESQHQRKCYNDTGFVVWKYGEWAPAGARSWANVTGLHTSNTYTAAFR